MTARDETPPPAAPERLPITILAATSPGRLPRVSADPGYEALAGCLESDLQGGLSGVARLLAELERVERGEAERFERNGNAYRLSLEHGLALLQPLENSQLSGCRIDAILLRRCIEAWRVALRPG